MTQEIILLATGMVVVLLIMGILILCIEVIVRTDHWFRDRAQAKKAAALAAAADRPSEDSRAAEVAAAIGLALHQYFAERAAPAKFSPSASSSSSWAAAGRTGQMSDRHRVQSRPKR